MYYYYHLFYVRVFAADSPHFEAYFALSASLGFLANGILDMILLKYFCYNIGKWPMLAIFGAILVVNYWYYAVLGNGRKVVKNKPNFFGNNKISIAIVIIFFLTTTSWLFWGPVYGKYLLGKCH